MDDIKQVIIVRSDIEMGRGKVAAQVAHASLMSYFEAESMDREIARKWLETGEKKIVLKLEGEDALRKFFEAFKFKKIPCALVSDAGFTQIPPGTKTALGVGPWASGDIDLLTRGLKLL